MLLQISSTGGQSALLKIFWVELIEGQCASFFLSYMMYLRFRILNKNRTGWIHLSYVSSEGKSILNYIIYRKGTSVTVSLL